MNVLFVSIDSLRRDFLNAYRGRPFGIDYDVATPNLDRFADRETVSVFDTHYAGSMFCMPTRREWLAGVQEFPWRGWGPIEPFDTTLPLAARETGTFTQLVTDHYHYFQHGAHGYYEDYNAFEFIRGHECDSWRGIPRHPGEELLKRAGAKEPDDLGFMQHAQYARNVAHLDEEDETDFFAPRVFSKAREFVTADDWDRWFCYVDSFDIHQPFHIPEPYASMYTDEDPTDPDLSFWPHSGKVGEGQGEISARQLDFVKAMYAGKLTMVDEWFGHLLNALTEQGLWHETIVVVTSDHGYSLGDYGHLGKVHMPNYDILARTPLFIHHPDGRGDRIERLTAAVDLHPTLLDMLEATDAGDHPHGQSLLSLFTACGANDLAPYERDWAIYGEWGSGINITDGRYTYMHPCDPLEPAHVYSTEMLNSRGIFQPVEPKTDATSGPYLPYTDSPVWRFKGEPVRRVDEPKLYETASDPRQTTNFIGERPAEANRMRGLLATALENIGAPESLFARLEGDLDAE